MDEWEKRCGGEKKKGKGLAELALEQKKKPIGVGPRR